MARVKAEVRDNDEVIIRYLGLTDDDGDAQELVLRLRVYEDTNRFELSIETEADSDVVAELRRARDITLRFEDIPATEDWDDPDFDTDCAASCSCQCDTGGCDCHGDEASDTDDEECDCCGDPPSECDCDESCGDDDTCDCCGHSGGCDC